MKKLEDKLEDLDSLSLNYWFTKFVQEVANKNDGRYPRGIFNSATFLNCTVNVNVKSKQ